MPSGVTIGMDGALWVVDTGNNRLAKFLIWK
jgi:streptogramin lyase